MFGETWKYTILTYRHILCDNVKKVSLPQIEFRRYLVSVPLWVLPEPMFFLVNNFKVSHYNGIFFLFPGEGASALFCPSNGHPWNLSASGESQGFNGTIKSRTKNCGVERVKNIFSTQYENASGLNRTCAQNTYECHFTYGTRVESLWNKAAS